MIERVDQIAFDTEFVSEDTYRPELCLIQIGTKEKVALIDALVEELDLSPFCALMRNPDIVKVFPATALGPSST